MEQERLIKEAQKSLRVSPDASARYIQAKDALLDEVNTVMAAHPRITGLIGGNAISMMQDNHRNHIDFMATVFQFNSFEMLAKTIPWVYRSYHAHGFLFDYFPLELATWKQAVEKHLPSSAADEINAIYDWMLKNHCTMINLSAIVPAEQEAYPELADDRRNFGTYLLTAEFRAGIQLAESILAKENGQEALYLGLIQPVMYEIGRLWEQDKISTAEEHLATSLVGRILSGLYARLPLPPARRGKAVVTCAPNEYHELGGRMLADMLEAAGWDVLFLGANTPAEELLKLLRKNKPRFLAISLTMPFNIDKVAAIIASLRSTPDLGHIRVLVGGSAFNADHHLWQKIGADAWARDPQAAIQQVLSW